MVMDTSQFSVIWTNKKRDQKFSTETHQSNAKWLYFTPHVHMMLIALPCDFVISYIDWNRNLRRFIVETMAIVVRET